MRAVYVLWTPVRPLGPEPKRTKKSALGGLLKDENLLAAVLD
jgi:hypothetical protein